MRQKSKQGLEILQEDGVITLGARTLSHLKNRYKAWLVKSHFQDENILSDSQLSDVCDRFWCMEEETEIRYTNPSEKGAPTEFTQYLSDYQPDPRFVCECSSCYLSGPRAIGFTREGRLILATASGDREIMKKKWGLFFNDLTTRDILSPSHLNKPKYRDGAFKCIFPLVPFYAYGGYYHWIVEYLPKLRALEEYEDKTGTKPTILVEADPASFMIDSLSLLGYNSDRLTEWQSVKIQHANKMVVTNHRPQYISADLSHSIDDYHWLRDQMRSVIGGISQESQRKIYISRQQSNRGRKIVNHGEVVNEIESRGFESVVLESLSLEKQIKIMAEADTILGPHGAGLVNMIFSDDPTIVELLPDKTLNRQPYFYMLSDLLGFDYNSLITETNEQNNLVVDIEELCEILDEANL